MPASTGSTSASTRCGPRRSRRSPGATGSTTSCRARGRAGGAGLGPVKVNAVLLRGVNDDQAPELLRWCLDRGYELRFIEQMPLDAQHGWSREAMITADEIFALARAGVRAHAGRRAIGAARPPSSSWSTAARRRSASSPRSPGRSAATATGCASPPTARSATACSPARSPTCGPPCGPARSDDEIADRWRRRDVGQAPRSRHRRPVVPAARRGRCRPSAAERSPAASA